MIFVPGTFVLKIFMFFKSFLDICLFVAIIGGVMSDFSITIRLSDLLLPGLVLLRL